MATRSSAWRSFPQRAHAIAAWFLGCSICDARDVYIETGPPCVNLLWKPETRKQVDVARFAYYGGAKSKTSAARYGRNVGKLRRHA